MAVELTDDPSAFRSRDWSELVAADPGGTIFHTPRFLQAWWEAFGSGPPLLGFVTDQDRVEMAVAFEVVGGNTLAFLGGFEVTDYLGPVGRPGVEERAAKELLAGVAAEGAWTQADLRGLLAGSPWLNALDSAAASNGLGPKRRRDGTVLGISLPATYQDYLASLSPKLRHEIQRKERRLSERAPGFRVSFSTVDSIGRDLDRFIALHRSSPGPKGAFMDAGMERFFRRLAGELLPAGRLWLAFLQVDGVQAAGAVGFSFRGTMSLYNSAFDRRFAAVAPGMVLVARLIEHAIETRAVAFDLLKGDLQYKHRFGAKPRAMERLILGR